MKKTFLSLLSLMMCLMVSAQQFELRLLNHWDNPNGTVERGFAGHSIWKWEEIPSGKGKMPAALKARYEEYAKINQRYGINGTVLNNVNAKPLALSTDMLKKTKMLADIFRPYGIKVYLSVNFASPKALGDVETADPLNKDVQLWWQNKVKEIYKLIPDFGGFLVKANSEGEPGPMDYGRTHVDGANMLANALKPYNGIVMWRAFVYSSKATDRANQAYEEFINFDGQFADNVIIQIKNGPIDFQPREAVSPLFFGLKKTKMMVEFQITQEYTGESVHTCFLAPMWREFFDTIKFGAGAPTAAQKASGAPIPALPNLVGVAGVANIGDSLNWTANDLAMSNWYAFGRLANDVNATSRDIAETFLKENYTEDPGFVTPMTQLLLKSREAVVDYMMPMGLHHIFAGGHHYGPEPWYAPRGSREDWLPRFYHRADSLGIGFNRSDHEEPCLAGNMGSNNVAQYPEPLRTLYNNIETCPDNLILWFHHASWDHAMSNGLTVWENLFYTYDRGIRQANDFLATWKAMKPYFGKEGAKGAMTQARYDQQLIRFDRQAKDAQWWKDACMLYFQTFSHKPWPVDSPKPHFTLEQVMKYQLRMDNYTAADPTKLPW